MTPLLLSLTLTAPAHPPARVIIAPNVRVQPQVTTVPVYRPPVVVVPLYSPPTYVVPQQPFVPPQQFVPQAITLGEFSRFFTPTPGKHDVWVVHPVTRQPVRVCFVLPEGKLREFEVDRRSIRFEFRNTEVEIDFRSNGTVDVRYRN